MPAWPALRHWFGVGPADIGSWTEAEVWELLDALETLPPVGCTFMVSPKGA